MRPNIQPKQSAPDQRDQLIAVRSLLRDSWKPGRLAHARDGRGMATLKDRRNPPCFFSIGGAVQREVQGIKPQTQTMQLIRAVCIVAHGMSVTVWEDQPGRSLEDVLALLDLALAAYDSPYFRNLAAYADGDRVSPKSGIRAASWLRGRMGHDPEQTGLAVAA